MVTNSLQLGGRHQEVLFRVELPGCWKMRIKSKGGQRRSKMFSWDSSFSKQGGYRVTWHLEIHIKETFILVHPILSSFFSILCCQYSTLINNFNDKPRPSSNYEPECQDQILLFGLHQSLHQSGQSFLPRGPRLQT